MNKYNYGNKSFKTKKELEQTIIKFLNDTPNHTIIDHNEENAWIYALFDTHPKVLNMADMKYLEITTDKTNILKSFFIHNKDDTLKYISYTSCLRNKSNTYTIKAFRDDIAHQLIEFRNDLFDGNKRIVCEETGVILKNNKYTYIDHNYRKLNFIALVKMFCDRYVVDFDTPIVSNGSTHTIKDDNIRNCWILFHKNNAILRAIYYKKDFIKDLYRIKKLK